MQLDLGWRVGSLVSVGQKVSMYIASFGGLEFRKKLKYLQRTRDIGPR